LQDRARELAEELEIPGVAVGVFHDEEERYAYHGVTSVEHPLPVDAETLFQFGSTGKTFTSLALLRLVEAGTLDLDAPVRTYVPELTLRGRNRRRDGDRPPAPQPLRRLGGRRLHRYR